MDIVTTLCGLVGVACVLAAYALLATGKISDQSVRYQWLNIAGAVGILLSLIGEWNLPAFLANFSWAVIGALGLWRIRRKGRV